MTDTMAHLTTRVPQRLIDDLSELAKQRRMQTGEDVRRADLVREALESMVKGESGQGQPSLLAQALNCPDDDKSIRLALEVIVLLAQDAAQRGLLTNPAQELGKVVFAACKDQQDSDLLTNYVSKLHGALLAL